MYNSEKRFFQGNLWLCFWNAADTTSLSIPPANNIWTTTIAAVVTAATTTKKKRYRYTLFW